MRKTKPITDRLWSRVDVSAGVDGCWPWLGATNPKGYGRITRDGRDVIAHRISLELALGRRLERGEFALHHCDNPPCCNPTHLFVGTLADNNRDMAEKGRVYRPQWRGQEVPNAKLTSDQVGTIRRRYAAGGITQGALAGEYGVTQPTLQAVIARRTWRHVL